MNRRLILLLAIITMVSCNSNRQAPQNKDAGSPQNITVVNKGNVEFDRYFTNKTMRLDYFHSGTAQEEHFAVDQTVNDGNWPGNKSKLIDKLERGPYFFEVIDKASKVLLYSRGFSNVFSEWQSVPEAKTQWGTFHESLRFPWPLKPVTVIVKKRDASNKFAAIWSTDIDPASRQVNPAEMIHTNKVDVMMENGPAAEKIDLVILGDGYTGAEMEKFRKDAKRLTGALFNAEPFKSRIKDFNVRLVETPSKTSGVTKPHLHVYKRTPLSVHYSSFDSERYALTYDNKTIRDVASAVPYDFMIILVNERTYGGGGIYGLYTTVSVDNKYANYIMIHELGHHMAALADEYYTSAVSYEIPKVTVEPWEPNITAMFDKDKLKWKDLVEAGTPLPTPWNKDEFDKFEYKIQKTRDSIRAALLPETVMEALFDKQQKAEDTFFAKEKYKDKVGAFEGAGYNPKGLYRPQLDCIMYSRHMIYCKVCQRSLNQVMDEYVK
ncbi:MAG: M64 family metallopeptidase [Bacteroidota bacterium]|nr:M64 family metallopeptidase [Bacteroidota bacterium]